MKLQEVTTYDLKSQIILNESWGMLTEAQRIHVGQWEKRVWPLMEQLNVLLERELTPDEIQTIFQNAENVKTQSGDNKTALGKAGELTSKVTSKIKAEIEDLAAKAKNSGPIKNMDQQFRKLRADIALRLDSTSGGQKVLDAVDQWKKWSDENPGKSAFVIGAMTSILAFASGGFFSGAAIGFFLKLANNTLKGDDLSTAIGKGVKGAALGAVAGGIGGVVADLLPDDLADTILGANGDIDVNALDGMDASSLEDLSPQEAGDLLKTQEAFLKGLEDAIDDEAKSALQAELDQIDDKIEQLGGENDVEAYADQGVDSGGAEPEADVGSADPRQGADWDELEDWEKAYELKVNVQPEDWTPEDFRIVKADGDMSPMDAAEYFAVRPDAVLQYSGGDMSKTEDFLKQMIGDEAWESASNTAKEDAVDWLQTYAYGTPRGESLEEKLWDEFALYEAGFADMIAKGKDKIKQTGKNIANKVTADKLNSMWKKSGSPTDTGSIINILSTAGLSDSEIGAVGREANVKLTKVTNKPGEKDQAASSDIQQRMEKFAADVKKHNLQKEVIAMLNAQGDVQQPTKQTGGAGKAGTQQGGYDTTVTQKKQQPAKPKLSTSGASMNPAYN